jgi:hypothetical protein
MSRFSNVLLLRCAERPRLTRGPARSLTAVGFRRLLGGFLPNAPKPEEGATLRMRHSKDDDSLRLDFERQRVWEPVDQRPANR